MAASGSGGSGSGGAGKGAGGGSGRGGDAGLSSRGDGSGGGAQVHKSFDVVKAKSQALHTANRNAEKLASYNWQNR